MSSYVSSYFEPENKHGMSGLRERSQCHSRGRVSEIQNRLYCFCSVFIVKAFDHLSNPKKSIGSIKLPQTYIFLSNVYIDWFQITNLIHCKITWKNNHGHEVNASDTRQAYTDSLQFVSRNSVDVKLQRHHLNVIYQRHLQLSSISRFMQPRC